MLIKYKITYNNVTKGTILKLIITTENNQKSKIFGLNEQKQLNNNLTYGINIKNNEASNIPFALHNNLINNGDKQSRNNSGNKKGRIKYKNKKVRKLKATNFY